ncbi:MAG: hypothetical protein ACHP6J_05610 [Burkholderiales bacterium]
MISKAIGALQFGFGRKLQQAVFAFFENRGSASKQTFEFTVGDNRFKRRKFSPENHNSSIQLLQPQDIALRKSLDRTRRGVKIFEARAMGRSSVNAHQLCDISSGHEECDEDENW